MNYLFGRRRLLGMMAALGATALAGCETLGVYRFRLTVEIDTPQGVRSGSSVMQVRYGLSLNFNGGGQQGDTDLVGEGVYVDLGGGRHVVAVLGQPLLRSGAWERKFLPANVLLHGSSGLQQIKDLKAEGRDLEGSADVPFDQIPSMVTFERSNDPASAKVVWGKGFTETEDAQGYRVRAVRVDDFAETFGPGHGLRRVWLEMVARDTPITSQLGTRFPWLRDPRMMAGDGWLRIPEDARQVIILMTSGT